ncbi:MAG: peptide chain release factor N(5)-glutamine methyltransferase [Chlamydiales bacterium]
MKTILELLHLSTHFLEERGVERPRRSAEEVVAFALGKKRLDLYLEHDRPISEEELVKCRACLKRRGTGEPVPYIVGEVEFAGVTLEVNRNVLIPRIETELLVEKISSKGILWDVCCGSGALGIALKKRYPDLQVTLSDISEEALAVAKRNAQRNQVEVEFRQGDFLEPFVGEKCDILVCNPPYVTEEEFKNLSPEVRLFEPKLALVGGLAFYERLAKADHYGTLYCEIGAKQGATIKKLFGGGTVEKDLSGLDRFFIYSYGSIG